jgi:triacylglycerol esterase/lipase EstA (alpha/beta hydrolase family)
LSALLEAGITVKYISFVGHSLGGLVSRYAIGVLYAAKFFDKVKPMNFTTFATPHLGARIPLPTNFSLHAVYNSTYNFLAPTLAGGRSGMDLVLSAQGLVLPVSATDIS